MAEPKTADPQGIDPAPPTVVTNVPPSPPTMARLNCQIRTVTEDRLKKECEARMIGVGLVVDKALNKFLDELPPPL